MLGVIVILSTAAIIHIIPPLRKAKADAALEMVLGEMRLAHERAINERRIYRFTFVAPQTIQLEVGTPANLQARISGSAAAFAQAQPPLVLPQTIQFLAAPPDGRALDAQNRLNNGVVYLADPNQLLSSRAVSLFGSTGRVKGWILVQNPNGSVRWTQ